LSEYDVAYVDKESE